MTPDDSKLDNELAELAENAELVKKGNQRRRLVIAGAMVMGPMIVAGSAQSARAAHGGTHSSTGSTG